VPGDATDDGVAVLYRGSAFIRDISERTGAAAYFVDADGDAAIEELSGDAPTLVS
jgi:hypothetical protein